MKVWIFTICWNEARMATWFLRHYAPWVDRIVVWCEPSTDGTEAILKSFPKVDLRVWPFRGLDDERFIAKVNTCRFEAIGKADWIAFVDMDELLYHENFHALLSNRSADVIQAKGYALISPTGWPEDDGESQLLDLVQTGIPQPNYDKKVLFRPDVHLIHTIGRHTYDGQWPRHNGREWNFSSLKLFHCHHVGGVEDTALRNARCYDRAVNKRYAWNYSEGHNGNPAQVGTVAWVRDAIENNKLERVV
jgi:hypothetical protein